MQNKHDSQLLDLGVLRLERAIQRLRAQDREGALLDLHGALRHMQEAKVDPQHVAYLADIIGTVEERS